MSAALPTFGGAGCKPGTPFLFKSWDGCAACTGGRVSGLPGNPKCSAGLQAGLRLPDASAIANLPTTTGFEHRGQLWLADDWRDLFAPRCHEAKALNRRVVCFCRDARKSGHFLLMHALIRGIRDDALDAR